MVEIDGAQHSIICGDGKDRSVDVLLALPPTSVYLAPLSDPFDLLDSTLPSKINGYALGSCLNRDGFAVDYQACHASPTLEKSSNVTRCAAMGWRSSTSWAR